MDVRCERCRAQYAVVDARVSEAGVPVTCGSCGHAFLLRKKVLSVTVPLKGAEVDSARPIADLLSAGEAASRKEAPSAERGEWRLRQAGGSVFPFRELSTLQRWIVERKATRGDEVASAGEESWRRLEDIPELKSFFALVDRADRPAPGPPPVPDPATDPGPRRAEEDPAWARGPVAPARRITRSALRPPRRRRRVIWVVLIAVALVGLAAATILLRRRAEEDAAALSARMQAAIAPGGAQKQAAPPQPAAPERRADPVPAPGPVAAVATVATVATAEPAAGSAPAPTGPSAGGPAQADAGPADPAQAVVPGQGVTVAPTGGVADDARVDAGTPSATPAAVARDVPVRPPRDEPASLLRTTLARAREQRDRGRCESALVLYGKALSLDGRNAVALAGRGACYLELTRYVQAEASFEAALESDPRNAEAIYGMAETYRYMGRKAEAVAFYERFLTVRPAGDDAAAARRLISQLKE